MKLRWIILAVAGAILIAAWTAVGIAYFSRPSTAIWVAVVTVAAFATEGFLWVAAGVFGSTAAFTCNLASRAPSVWKDRVSSSGHIWLARFDHDGVREIPRSGDAAKPRIQSRGRAASDNRREHTGDRAEGDDCVLKCKAEGRRRSWV